MNNRYTWNIQSGAGKRALWLRVLGALHEDQGWIPSACMETQSFYNSSPRKTNTSLRHLVLRHTCRQNIYTHNFMCIKASLWVWDQPGQYSKFQASQGYIARPWLKTTKTKKTKPNPTKPNYFPLKQWLSWKTWPGQPALTWLKQEVKHTGVTQWSSWAQGNDLSIKLEAWQLPNKLTAL